MTTESRCLIHFDRAGKSYAETQALAETSLTIEQGEFVTIIGTSGCGKTTLLKLCNGLILPDTGSVAVCGMDTKRCSLVALRRSIGYVIQNIGLFPHLNIEQNITYVPRVSRLIQSSAELRALASDMLSLVGLEATYAGRYPAELSGGQMQRIGIARALAAGPRLLLMDEPFSAVDEITRRRLQRMIYAIWKDQGITVLFITHDIQEALKLGTRVLVMDSGRIVQDAAPKDIQERPATDFVRELISESIWAPAG